MPFGINSAPEVWQRRMNEVIEGLPGVEVIADDFLVCGFGETHEAAIKNHDENLCLLLQRARERGLKLNKEKIKLRLTKVPFIGHLLTPEGLAPDPAKIQAVLSMPTPTDLKSLQRFLGMTQYLAKFLPRLSEVTESLRKLEHKGVVWNWLPAHNEAITAIKQLISQAPVLRYYDVKKEVIHTYKLTHPRLAWDSHYYKMVNPCLMEHVHSHQLNKIMLRLRRKCLQSW